MSRVIVGLLWGLVVPIFAFADPTSPTHNVSTPDDSKIIYNKKLSTQIFLDTKRAFIRDFDQESFIRLLKDIVAGYDVFKWEVKNMKANRMKAQRLRVIFEFFDKRHQTPKGYNQFIVKYGKLKDALMADVDPLPYASDLLELLKKQKIEEILEDFRPSGLRDLRRYTRSRLENLEDLAASKKVTRRKYHKLRKGLRGIYYVLNYLNFDSDLASRLIRDISDVEQAMGLTHDFYEEKKLRGEAIPESLPIPAEAVYLIEKTKALLSLNRNSCRDILN